MKRKRKEHRSLDSILFEDDGELEYFDVLNLLPLSNIRLEYNDTDSLRDGNFTRKKVHGLRDLSVHEPSGASEVSPTRSSNATDEEKCKEHTVNEDNPARVDDKPEKEIRENFDSSKKTNSSRRKHRETDERFANSEISSVNKFADQHAPSSSSSKTDHRGVNVENFITSCEEEDQKIEEVGDYKSIWISGNDRNEMSRRPQILKVVDNDVTRRRHRRSVVEIDAIVEDVPKDKRSQEITKETNERIDTSVIKSINNVNEENEVHGRKAKVSIKCDGIYLY